MKLKVKPEDFVVEEIIDLPISKKGPYTLLKLQKKYWNTLDVIYFVARKLAVSKQFFSRAGLKDRYSFSTQYLTYKGDFQNIIKEKNFTVVPIGRVAQQISPKHLICNRFSITLRDLNDNDLEKIQDNYSDILEFGFPNYFDEQRFGSARHKKGFFARLLMLCHYNGALKILFCFPYKEDNIRIKTFKKYCLENWGNWRECFKLAPREFKKTFGYLIENPKDFKGTVKTIDREMLNLYLLAYQSYIFNQTLGLVIKDYGENIYEVPYSVGKFIFYKKLKDRKPMEKFFIPIINDKTILSGYIQEKIDSVLSIEGVAKKDFGLSKMRFRGVRFKSFLRQAIIFLKESSLDKPQVDEIYKGKKKIRTNFILPPGSYATLLIKRLMT